MLPIFGSDTLLSLTNEIMIVSKPVTISISFQYSEYFVEGAKTY